MTNPNKMMLNNLLDITNSIEESIAGEGFRDFITRRKNIIQVVNQLIDLQTLVKFLPEDFQKLDDTIWNDISTLDKKVVSPETEVDGEAVWNYIKKTIPIFQKELISLLKMY
jgi:uncharacterized protein with HEPN domain